jgi:bacteriocin biosynthesis cyclodehydratase domain-containing protein
VLRPGLHVLRRSASELQVGLDPQRAVVLPDDPAVRSLLEALTSPADPLLRPGRLDERQNGTLETLRTAGLLVDADLLLPLLPHRPTPGEMGRDAVAAVALEHGDQTGPALSRRAACPVSVAAFGADSGPASEVEELLRVSGAGVTPFGRDSRLTVLAGVGEPDREVTDPWMRSGHPHLLLRLVEGSATVGPFVIPGETACLRCIDAHHADVDPAWPLLVAQYARAGAATRPDGMPEPQDPLLLALVAACAARDAVTWAEGRVPGTASTTLRVDPQLSALETHTWLRHPDCGCGWA